MIINNKIYKSTYSKNDTKMPEDLLNKILNITCYYELRELVESNILLGADGFNFKIVPTEIKERVELIKAFRKKDTLKVVTIKKGGAFLVTTIKF